MMKSKSTVAILGIALLATTLAACQKKDETSGKGPAEKAGEQIDRAATKAGEELNKAGEKAGQAMQEAGKKLEDKSKDAQK
jgi:predicted small secreted protein